MSENERCPRTDLLVRDCHHCRDSAAREQASYVITVDRRKRGGDQPRTLHRPDCWHARNDTEPPEPNWAAVEPVAADPSMFTIRPEVWEQDEQHRDWEATGRLSRRTVVRQELRFGRGGTVEFEGKSYRPCRRCAPDL